MMTFSTTMKLGQIVGALLLAGGVASCQLRSDPSTMSVMFLAGALLYGGCRLAAWLRRAD